jgi:hypothetical protein
MVEIRSLNSGGGEDILAPPATCSSTKRAHEQRADAFDLLGQGIAAKVVLLPQEG